MAPGDTVAVREGRYPGFDLYNLQGAEDAYITFRSYPCEHVTLDSYLGAPEWHVVHFRGECSYIRLIGFEITSTHPLIDELRELDITQEDDLAQMLEHLDDEFDHVLVGSGPTDETVA